MGYKPKWIAQLVTEDEQGRPETWDFRFRRPTSKTMLELAQAETVETDAEKVALVIGAMANIVAAVKKNGQPAVLADMPFELCEEAISLHPTFRDAQNAGA